MSRSPRARPLLPDLEYRIARLRLNRVTVGVILEPDLGMAIHVVTKGEEVEDLSEQVLAIVERISAVKAARQRAGL